MDKIFIVSQGWRRSLEKTAHKSRMKNLEVIVDYKQFMLIRERKCFD